MDYQIKQHFNGKLKARKTHITIMVLSKKLRITIKVNWILMFVFTTTMVLSKEKNIIKMENFYEVKTLTRKVLWFLLSAINLSQLT
jgi:hypothetical protein